MRLTGTPPSSRSSKFGANACPASGTEDMPRHFVLLLPLDRLKPIGIRIQKEGVFWSRFLNV